MLLDFIEDGKEDIIETFEEEGKPTETISKASELTYEIVKRRFEIELKQYNNDKDKAHDEFITRKNLVYLRIFIEDFLLLDKVESDIDFYKVVRKNMRDLLNNLYFILNNQ